jgi:hypothetical protein
MSNAWAIGLYAYPARRHEERVFRQFYELALHAFEVGGVPPTYFAADGTGYSGKLTKWGGRTQSKAINTGFADIQVMSLVSNPEESDEPGFDRSASASLSYVESAGELLLCVMMEERLLAFASPEFERLLESFLTLVNWDFGYALCQPVEKKPEFHVLGIDGGDLDQEERRRLNAWYAAAPGERVQRLRDVYPYLLLNSQQLHAPISETQTVEDLASSETASVLTRQNSGALWMWKIQSNHVESLRETLRRGGVLIT